MDRDDAVVGERYAYRARAVDPLVEVEVLKVGTQRPARVQIRWVDEEFEGRQEWVPPTRLKVVWSGVENFVADEARWAAVREPSPGRNCIEDSVVWEIFDAGIDADIAECGYNADSGVIKIHDVTRLSELLDIPEVELRADPRSFELGSTLVASWVITELVSRRAAVKFADRLLEQVAVDDQKAQQEAIHGYYTRGRSRDDVRHMSAEICREVDVEYGAPRRALMREWCGSAAVERQDELVALREEVLRLGGLVQQAADRLRQAGFSADAHDLERRLGVPVDEVR
ncbi:hypothetical protein C8K36_108222 [Rhodococcus sp. OK519]|uniref:hypothetical protein n=1 Tax=Rhodococcus sp. OK519 TaxID=2135729 RepID=UPI000D363CC0|nr:hypothetical protein C8K36_108222 [Rhodococcus sp. OK519]